MHREWNFVVTTLLVLVIASAVWLKAQTAAQVDETQNKMAIVHVFNQARERCYSSADCPIWASCCLCSRTTPSAPKSTALTR